MTALPHAVLFDMDGTLVDTEPLWFVAERDVMVDLGGAWDERDHAACLGGAVPRTVAYMAARLPGEHDHADLGERLMSTVVGLIADADLRLLPGARELLADAADLGLPRALVSASWRRIIDAVGERISTQLGAQVFDVVVAGDEVADTKPHPEPYRTAAAALGFWPGDCLAIEDSPTGIASARAAGCGVVAITHANIALPAGVASVDSLAGHTVAGLWALTRA